MGLCRVCGRQGGALDPPKMTPVRAALATAKAKLHHCVHQPLHIDSITAYLPAMDNDKQISKYCQCSKGDKIK